MDFSPHNIYHVHNRGNNSQTIFFTHGNYLFFLEKFRKYILPHADILAWCLMPNHFHLMISVDRVEIEIREQVTRNSESEGFTSSMEVDPMTRVHRINKQNANFTHPMNSSHRMSSNYFVWILQRIGRTN